MSWDFPMSATDEEQGVADDAIAVAKKAITAGQG
jgi:hypothetical protein